MSARKPSGTWKASRSDAASAANSEKCVGSAAWAF
jgi:hypothetical protein